MLTSYEETKGFKKTCEANKTMQMHCASTLTERVGPVCKTTSHDITVISNLQSHLEQ